MPDTPKYLLSALLVDLPTDRRVALERELVPVARALALGELAGDIGHDLANPLFAILGLVELLLLDAAPGSHAADRLRLVERAGLELKDDVHALLDYARPLEGHESAELAAAARTATALVRHGYAKELQVTESYSEEQIIVRCPAGELVQAVLHLVAGARSTAGDAGASEVEAATDAGHGLLRVRPAAPDGVGVIAANRIAADHGGSLKQERDAFELRLPLWGPADRFG
jgi:signal transduction histidine kinase